MAGSRTQAKRLSGKCFNYKNTRQISSLFGANTLAVQRQKLLNFMYVPSYVPCTSQFTIHHSTRFLIPHSSSSITVLCFLYLTAHHPSQYYVSYTSKFIIHHSTMFLIPHSSSSITVLCFLYLTVHHSSKYYVPYTSQFIIHQSTMFRVPHSSSSIKVLCSVPHS